MESRSIACPSCGHKIEIVKPVDDGCEINYVVIRVGGEIWLVPDRFPKLGDLRKSLEAIRTGEKLLTDSETKAIMDVVCNPHLLRIKDVT